MFYEPERFGYISLKRERHLRYKNIIFYVLFAQSSAQQQCNLVILEAGICVAIL